MTSGYQWYIQVIYVIIKSGASRHHFNNKRSAMFPQRLKRESSSGPETKGNNSDKNGTNIHYIPIDNKLLLQDKISQQTKHISVLTYVLPTVLLIVIIIVIIIFIIFKRRRRKKKEEVMGVRKNNLEIAKENSLFNQNRLSLRLSGSKVNVNVTEVKDSIVMSSKNKRQTNVKIKNTNVKTQGKVHGTEV